MGVYVFGLGIPGLLLVGAGLRVLAGDPVPGHLPPWAGAIALWPGTALVVVAGAYVARWSGRSPGRLLARAPGACRILWGFATLPYAAGAWILLVLTRAVTRESVAHVVAPSLWLGGVPLPWQGPPVRARGIDAVLNLCLEFGDMARLSRDPALAYRRVPLLDGSAPLPDEFREAVEWATARLAEGRTLLVHCAQGHGRSATVAAALLVVLGRTADSEAAFAALAAVRPRVHPSTAQKTAVGFFLKPEA
ncbi:MAG: dual specificity protein phosphatase family protein [Planctomycetes bacterium]|nr:dual specificity protein phosphatase family protein [Planctomycetota bacterium]